MRTFQRSRSKQLELAITRSRTQSLTFRYLFRALPTSYSRCYRSSIFRLGKKQDENGVKTERSFNFARAAKMRIVSIERWVTLPRTCVGRQHIDNFEDETT